MSGKNTNNDIHDEQVNNIDEMKESKLTLPMSEPAPVDDSKSFQEAPFSYSMQKNETVLLASGALTHTLTDFILPGRNGFDLIITRRYNSDNANLMDINPGYNEAWQLETGLRKNNHDLVNYGLGYGWHFVLPSIEITPLADRRPYVEYEPYLHLDDGRNFKIKDGRLHEHPLKDVEAEESSGTINHPFAQSSKSYNLIIKYKDGSRDYFQKNMQDGKADSYTLAARQDMLGNCIFYSLQPYGGMEIIDSWGQSVSLVKSGGVLKWLLPDGGEISYESDGERLLGVVDQVGRKTRYEYTVLSAQSCFSGDSVVDIEYLLLTGVGHVTGAKTSYEYGIQSPGSPPQPLRLNFKEHGGYRQFFPLLRRNDKALDIDYHTGTYTYTLSVDKQYISRTDAAYLNSVSEQHSLNDKGQLVKKEVYHSADLVQAFEYSYGTDEAGPDYKLITRREDKTYNPGDVNSYISFVAQWVYTQDKKADISLYKESWPDDAALDRQTGMSYGEYSILTEKTVEGSCGQIRESYTLRQSPDNKVVEFRRIYENGVLKEKSRYLYGSGPDEYCLVEQQDFYGEALENSAACRRTLFSYDASIKTHSPVSMEIPGILDADGNEAPAIRELYGYDACGRLASLTDAGGGITKTVYDKLGRVIEEEYPSTGLGIPRREYIYDNPRNTITQTDENGHQSVVSYTPLGQVMKEELIENGRILIAEYAYDNLERLVLKKSYDGYGYQSSNIKYTTAFSYDNYGRPLDMEIAEANMKESSVYTDVFIGPDNKKYSRREKTVYGEDGSPDIVSSSLVNPRGEVIMEYMGGELVSTSSYDRLGNRISSTDALGSIQRWAYDYAGRVVSDTSYDEVVPRTSHTAYDALGNRVSFTDYGGRQSNNSYDIAGRLICAETPFDSRNATAKYYYSGTGKLLAQKIWAGENWRETAYVYDARGRQTESIIYEDDDRLLWNKTRYSYDNKGNRLEICAGITQNEGDGRSTRYSYGRFGNLLKLTDAMGQTESYEYSPIGQLLAKTGRDKTRTEYSYDVMGRQTKARALKSHKGAMLESIKETVYYRSGRVKKEIRREVKNGEEEYCHETAMEYDVRDRLIRVTEPGGIEKALTYTATGSRESFKMLRGGIEELSHWYIYDSLGRLKELRQGGAAGKAYALYEYDINGNRSRQRNPDAGIESVYTYNRANLVTVLENKLDGQVKSWFKYQYSPDAQLLEEMSGDGKTSYSYDRLGRLCGEKHHGYNISYSYDRFNNRTEMRYYGHKPYTTTYEYDANNRLLKEKKQKIDGLEILSYTYDAAGNQIRRELEELSGRVSRPGYAGAVRSGDKTILDTREYNSFGMLTRVVRDNTAIEYTYRPDNLRHSKSVSNIYSNERRKTTHYWDSGSIVLESSGEAGEIKARYIRGSGLVAQQIDEELFYYTFNFHGDVVQRIGEGGVCAPKYSYDAFGNQKQRPVFANDGTDTDPNPFRYCGEYWDSDIEEIYLRARTYNPANGRFSGEDSIRAGNNWYVYCENSPLMSTDPSGNLSIVIPAITTLITNIVKNAVVTTASKTIAAVKSSTSNISKTTTTRTIQNSASSVNSVVASANNAVKNISGKTLSGAFSTFDIEPLIEAQFTPGIIQYPEYGQSMGVFAFAATAAVADGPLPVGDAIGAGAILVMLLLAAAADVSGKSRDISKEIAGGAASPNPDDPNGKRNWEKVGEEYLEKELAKQGTDPHDIKEEYLGKNQPVSKYDLYVDKNTGQIAIFRKATKKLVEITYYFIK